jgi:hypothetical protein
MEGAPLNRTRSRPVAGLNLEVIISSSLARSVHRPVTKARWRTVFARRTSKE